MSKCLQAYGVNIMQIRSYVLQTALMALVIHICSLFRRFMSEIGSWGVQMRSMMLTWQRRSRSSRLLPLATANRSLLVQKRRNRSSAAVSHHAFAPLTSCSCVAYNKISMPLLVAHAQPVFHFGDWSSSSQFILLVCRLISHMNMACFCSLLVC